MAFELIFEGWPRVEEDGEGSGGKSGADGRPAAGRADQRRPWVRNLKEGKLGLERKRMGLRGWPPQLPYARTHAEASSTSCSARSGAL